MDQLRVPVHSGTAGLLVRYLLQMAMGPHTPPWGADRPETTGPACWGLSGQQGPQGWSCWPYGSHVWVSWTYPPTPQLSA